MMIRTEYTNVDFDRVNPSPTHMYPTQVAVGLEKPAIAPKRVTRSARSVKIASRNIYISAPKLSDTHDLAQSSNLIERSFNQSKHSDGIDKLCSIFRLDDVIAEAIFRISKVAISNGVQIIFEPNYEAIVYADQDMIYAMAHNLIANAVKFTHKNEIIKVSSRIERDQVMVSIHNSGVGISKEMLEKLLQIDSNSTRLDAINEMVAAIELLLCHRFAEKNNGKLVVASGDEQGQMFTVTLPKVA